MKRIKRFGMICATVFTLLCISPLHVNAGTIETVEATGSTTGVNITGQTDTGVLAVVIQVRDSSNNILTMETFGVVDEAYQASITMNLVAGDYKVWVADFDGGDWCTDDFTVVSSGGGGTGTGNSSESSSGAGSAATSETATAPTETVTSTAPVESVQTEAPKSPKTGDNSGVLYGFVLVMGIVLFRRYMLYRQK